MAKRYDRAKQIVKTLRDHGHEALFAGGWVRDYLLAGRRIEPVTGDIDIATSAEPEKIKALFPRSLAIGDKFGIVAVLVGDDKFEVATFRREGDYRDGRHPDTVVFTDARTDALRRDFTINGLFYDPFENRVIDYVNGTADIESRLIRCIGDPAARFREDKLRLLRAVRLASQLDFAIEPETEAALRRYAPEITQVSWERIRDELCRILEGPRPDRGLNLLRETGLLKYILPEVAALDRIPQPQAFHPEGDALTHTILTVAHIQPPPGGRKLELALGALFHDVGKAVTMVKRDRIRFPEHDRRGAEITREALTRLRFPNKTVDQVVSLVAEHMRFKDFPRMRRATQVRWLTRPDFPLHLELHRADCLASHGDLTTYKLARDILREIENSPPPLKPLIRGTDLIEMGYRPGPLFSEILEKVEDARLEGEIKTRADAIEFVRRNFELKAGGTGKTTRTPG